MSRTPKVSLVPDSFFEEAGARELLSAVFPLEEGEKVSWIPVPQFSSVLVYADEGEFPQMYNLLCLLPTIEEYNKIIMMHSGSWLHLAIAQGRTLLLANVFPAPDFVTAQYYLFLAMKQLQLNPEQSVVYVRKPCEEEAMMSLYRYFKSVESI